MRSTKPLSNKINYSWQQQLLPRRAVSLQVFFLFLQHLPSRRIKDWFANHNLNQATILQPLKTEAVAQASTKALESSTALSVKVTKYSM